MPTDHRQRRKFYPTALLRHYNCGMLKQIILTAVVVAAILHVVALAFYGQSYMPGLGF